jgi:hypothetical protein
MAQGLAGLSNFVFYHYIKFTGWTITHAHISLGAALGGKAF